MKNIKQIKNKGEGLDLLRSYNWFKDIEVIKNFLKSVEEIALNLPPEVNILGIGSGVGNLEYKIKYLLEKKYGKKVNLTLTDKNIQEIIIKPRVRVLQVDNKKLIFDKNVFDLVIARSVTHYEKDENDELTVLMEIKRVLKNEGYFITEAPYLDNTFEAELMDHIHKLVFKSMNLKDYKKLLELHKKIFKKVILANTQPKKKLCVEKKDFIKRYGNLNNVELKILDLIKEYPLKQRPNVWIKNENFGWKISYATLICKK